MTETSGVLELLGVLEREISISRLIGAAISRSPAVLDVLAGKPGHRERITVQTERSFDAPSGRKRRADLCVTWWQDGAPHVLVVEHKLYAGESVDQSTDYDAARSTFEEWARQAFNDRQAAPAVARTVMLTLLGESPRALNLHHVRHFDLAEVLAAISGDDAAARLAREWASIVSQHESASMLDLDTPLNVTFPAHQGGGLDARFGRFQRLAMKIVDQCPQLESHGTYRSAREGLSWYGAHFALKGTAPEWKRNAKVPENPATDWWLHFQLRMDASGDGTLSLGAYCETLPYVTRKTFDKEAGDAAQRAAYLSARQGVSEGFQEISARPGSRWKTRGTWCQIARFDPSWEGSDPVSEVVLAVAGAMGGVADDVRRLLRVAGHPSAQTAD